MCGSCTSARVRKVPHGPVGPCDINLYLLYGYRSRVRGYERCARNAHVSRGTGCVRMVQQSPRNQEENA